MKLLFRNWRMLINHGRPFAEAIIIQRTKQWRQFDNNVCVDLSFLLVQDFHYGGGGGFIVSFAPRKRHYEPPEQNVSTVSQISLKLVSNCLKRSPFSLKYVSDKTSQFETFLIFETQLRLSPTDLFHCLIWEQFETFCCIVKYVSIMSQKGIRWSNDLFG